MTRVFLSYAHGDRDVAEEVSSVLRSVGISTAGWSEDIAVGDAWATAIDARLRSADAVIVLISKDYPARSAHAFGELSMALDGEKRLIPLIIERGARAPALLAPYVTLDVSDPRARHGQIRSLGLSLRDEDRPTRRDTDSQLSSIEAQLKAVRRASFLEEQLMFARTRKPAIATLLVGMSLAIAFVVVLALGTAELNGAISTAGVSITSALVGATVSLLLRGMLMRRESNKETTIDVDEVRR
ncbi:MAG: toll/interleukin-1 receptor domain-containing protein [Pseudonocardiaceae bacterium]